MNADMQRYVQAMPQYGESLDFLQRILNFQSTLADKIELGLRIELAAAREKWQAGRSLFAGESLPIPPTTFLQSLADLRSLLPAGETSQMSLDRLLASSLMTPSN